MKAMARAEGREKMRYRIASMWYLFAFIQECDVNGNYCHGIKKESKREKYEYNLFKDTCFYFIIQIDQRYIERQREHTRCTPTDMRWLPLFVFANPTFTNEQQKNTHSHTLNTNHALQIEYIAHWHWRWYCFKSPVWVNFYDEPKKRKKKLKRINWSRMKEKNTATTTKAKEQWISERKLCMWLFFWLI